MSHVVLTCTCATHLVGCPVPGHLAVPPNPIDPQDVADFGAEALAHLAAAEQSLLAARAAWVSRGLPASNPFPTSIDELVAGLHSRWEALRRWNAGARVVAERRQG